MNEVAPGATRLMRCRRPQMATGANGARPLAAPEHGVPLAYNGGRRAAPRTSLRVAAPLCGPTRARPPGRPTPASGRPPRAAPPWCPSPRSRTACTCPSALPR
eukprot:5218330-Prymnesium_polylepis.1